ncbi:MAG: PAS domain-containing protein [Syntrophobacter sp.]
MDWRSKVFDSLSLPTLILRPDKTIIEANRMFLSRYGYDMDEIVGIKCHDLFHDSIDHCSCETCPFPIVLKGRRGHSVLRRTMKANGQPCWEDRVFSPVIGDSGEVEYIIEIMQDVSRIKVLEKELSGIKEFTEKLVQSSASGIVAADMQGRIMVMNEAARELFGYKDEQVIRDISTDQLYPPGVAREIMRKLREPRLGGKGKLPSTRISILNAQGEQIPVEIAAAIIYEGEEESATMGIFTDLREKLAAEKKLREILNQTARAAKLASIGQLAAGVAHEINNPLTGIVLFAGMMLERLSKDDPQREELQCVIEDANRCRDIVKGLLAYSRQASPNMEGFHLNDLVEHGLGLIRDQRLFLHVNVVKELANETMLIHADINQLCQVVINLVMNALDAMKMEGTLTLRTYQDAEEGLAFLEVSDTGCGISEENYSRIFDPFFTTKGPGKGTGLGLSTAYGIIKENGGRISVKETSPGGTTFLIEFPLYQIKGECPFI